MKKKFFRILFYIAVTFSISQLNANIFAASLMDRFIDPNDGMFDSGTWLLEQHKGFLPVPQIITEPCNPVPCAFLLFILPFRSSFFKKGVKAFVCIMTFH